MPIELLNLPPREAIKYFRDKSAHIGFDWRDTAAEQHLVSFTAAKAMRFNILRDLNQAVDRTIAHGQTYRQFVDELQPKLQKLGWWGKTEIIDPNTGEIVNINIGPRHLRTIFDTNIRTSVARGRWQQIQRINQQRPYLRYVATLDARTRPEHARWHGTILPVDHSFWESHYPPNGWYCRCTVTQWSEDDLKQRKWKISQDPQIQTREYLNKRTGKVSQVPVGISPGFDHNIGKLSQRIEARNLLIEKAQSWPSMTANALKQRTRDFDNNGFRDFLQHARPGFQTYWPVAALLPKRAKELGLDEKPQYIDLSPDTITNHRHRFTNFTPEDWARVQRIVDEGEWIKSRPKHRLL